MDTNYAPAEREGDNEINVRFQKIQNFEHLRDLLDALPYVAAILNEKRQLIYCNNVLLKTIGASNISQILGKRPGEILDCQNSQLTQAGCGTTDKCKYCGAVNAILKSQKSGIKTSMECRIISGIKSEIVAYDLLATATPFHWNNDNYTILSLNDISNEKRRRVLEKIFFHDIINKAGSLSGYIELVKDIEDTKKIKEFVNMAGIISDELIEEIIAQRQLLSAENNELELNIETVFTFDLIKSVADQLMHHPVAEGKVIEVDANSINAAIRTDYLLLKRILTNMLKNAIEACNDNDLVKIGCYHQKANILFKVFNPGVIPDAVQQQLFQRSFSTKGQDRGLGTYSMKLIGEKYLKGKIGFESNKKTQTVFYLSLPAKPSEF